MICVYEPTALLLECLLSIEEVDREVVQADSVSFTVTVAGTRAENEMVEAKSEERRVEKSSREARDSLALSQAERAEPTLPALIIYLSRVRLQHSPHSTSLLIQLSLSSLPLLSIPTCSRDRTHGLGSTLTE